MQRSASGRPRGAGRLRRTFPVAVCAVAFVASLSLAAAGGGPVLAPPGRIPFRSYGAAQGLENSALTRVVQDAVGFVWAGTADGIYRYDGGRFTRFGLEDGLPSTWIVSIVPTSDGGLWVATVRGVAQWNGVGFVVPPALAGGPPPSAVTVDDEGVLWLAREDGLFRFLSGRLVREPAWSGEASAVWAEPATGRVLAAGTGRVGTRTRSGAWSFAAKDEGLLPERIDSVLSDAGGRTWARSALHLWCREPKEAAFQDLSARLPWTSSTGYLSRDRAGAVWVPTDRGLATFDGAAWRVVGAREGLPTQWARDLMEDREGSLWVASLGLHRMLGRGALTSYGRTDGLPEDVTWCFHVDRAGRLLVGTDQGLAQATPDGWRVVKGTERNAVRSVVEEPDGTLWAAGSPMEVVRIDPSGAVARFGAAAGLAGKAVLHLARDRSGTLWAATNGGGLLMKPASSARFTRALVPGGAATERFGTVLEDRAGRVWAAGEAGLACFSGGRWQRFSAKDGLARDHVSYLLASSSGDLWVSYFEPIGLIRVEVSGPPGGVAVHVAESVSRDGEGRTLGKIYLLGEDLRHRIWVGTGRGVTVFDGKESRHFGTGEGLAGDDTDAMAFLADRSGSVWVGTSGGFSRFAPQDAPAPPEPPVPVILSARLGASPVPLVPGAIPARPIEVGPRRNDLEVAFAGLSFRNESDVEHAYRLSGSGADWKVTTERSVTWRALPPGYYRFELRARRRGGAWSETVALPFTIRPAAWQTPLARAGGALAAALLLAGAVRWRTTRLQKRNEELERTVRDRTRELARANESLEALSVTDTLTGLHNRRYLHRCMPELAADALRAYAGLERERRPLVRTNGDLVFFMIDVDHFKRVNDEHGHLAGDHVLTQIGPLARKAMRESDVLVRWGGEEFLLLARGTSREEAPLVALRILTAFRAHAFSLPDGERCTISCSIGFAPFPFFPHDRDLLRWEDVVDLADAALLSAKRAGRSRWVGILPGPTAPRPGTAEELRTDLDAALSAGVVRKVASPE